MDDKKQGRAIRSKSVFWFEPEEPILQAEDFTRELIGYALREGKTIDILHEGMEPVARIGEKTYLFMLEQPRTLHFPFSIFFYTRSFGFKFAYAYEYE